VKLMTGACAYPTPLPSCSRAHSTVAELRDGRIANVEKLIGDSGLAIAAVQRRYAREIGRCWQAFNL
jgi:hypothetical protein